MTIEEVEAAEKEINALNLGLHVEISADAGPSGTPGSCYYLAYGRFGRHPEKPNRVGWKILIVEQTNHGRIEAPVSRIKAGIREAVLARLPDLLKAIENEVNLKIEETDAVARSVRNAIHES